MRKFIHKVQDLQKKAAELQQKIEEAPAQAARIREAVTMTAGELHQLRSTLQSDLSGLRTNSEERLIQAMKEIDESKDILKEAGYLVTGMDLDLAVVQRLAVHLAKTKDTHPSLLRALASKESRSATKSILLGLIQAERVADQVKLNGVHYEGVTIHVGPAPAVRM